MPVSARRYKEGSSIKVRLLSIGICISFLFIWDGIARTTSELVLPRPLVVFTVLWQEWQVGYFYPHIFQTALEVFFGLLIGTVLGVGIGIVMGEISALYRLFAPYVIASQAVPKLALAPLFVLWFGFGMTSKVIITALICFFPLLENTMTAIRQVDPQKEDLFYALEATRWERLIHLRIPAGLPTIMSGFRVAVVLALVGAVVGEFIGANKGLGALIIASQGMMDTPLMFAVLILLTLFGLLLYGVVYFIEKVILKKYRGE